MATSLTKISIKDSSSWNSFLDLIYPTGSLYFSSNSTSPATRFGGTWSALYASSANSARYLKLGPWGAGGDNTITVDNMPSHNHSFSARMSYQDYSQTTEANNFRTTFARDSTYYPSTSVKIGSKGGGKDFYPYYRSVYCWYRTA